MDLNNEYAEIVNSLYTATKSDELLWTRQNINNELLVIKTKGDDDTLFEVYFLWSFTNDKWQLANPYVKVKNEKIEFYIHATKVKQIFDLHSLLQKKYCPDFIKTDKDTLEIISSINKGISKSILRDNKLTKILTK